MSHTTHGRIVAERLSYAPADGRALFHDLTLSFARERTGLVGPNESGKTTLTGRVRRLPDEQIAFLDQSGVPLDPALSVLENFRLIHPRIEETAARYSLARFLFSDEAALQAVGTLSGGQRLRASLAYVLGGERPPALLVLDEPTNHLDLDALDALESALRGYDGALLVVSHDAAFLRAIGVERELALRHLIDPGW